MDKLVVKIDSSQVFPKLTGPTIAEFISIEDTYAHASAVNTWREPYSQSITCIPEQYRSDMRLNSTLPRYPKSAWTLTDSHWDDIARDYDAFLQSDGTTETIVSKATFPENSGFLLQLFIFGSNSETFEAVEVTIGQWIIKIRTDGQTQLYNGATLRAVGYITGNARDSLCGKMVDILIMPVGNWELMIRQRGVAGFTYKLPESEVSKSNPIIINSGAVSIKAVTGAIQFQLSRLEYNTSLTYTYTSPVLHFTKAPIVGQTLDIRGYDSVDVYGGVVAAKVIEETTTADFTPDGSKTAYRLQITLSPNDYTAPYIQGIFVFAQPIRPTTTPDPTDITADVMSCKLTYGETPLDTQAQITVRNAKNFGFYGANNRACKLMIGETILLEGMLAEPPTYSHDSAGLPTWNLTIQSLAKLLQNPCLPGSILFDNMKHTEAIQWLCYFADIDIVSHLVTDTDDTLLPDTRVSSNGIIDSKLKPNFADTPQQWIDEICNQTGWIFTDGVVDGKYVLRYVDPLDRSTTSIHTFVMLSEDEVEVDGEYPYQRVYSWEATNCEPEANEFHVIGCNARGEGLDACYLDANSQNAALDEGSRDANWLGQRKVAVMVSCGRHELTELEQLAFRIGSVICKSEFRANFEADWKVALCRDSVVSVNYSDNELTTGGWYEVPGLGDYRLSSVDIDFIDESISEPIRRARYEAIKI